MHLHGNNAAPMYEYGDFQIPHVLEVTLDSQGPEIPCVTAACHALMLNVGIGGSLLWAS